MATTAILDLQLKADSLETAHKVIHATLTDTRAWRATPEGASGLGSILAAPLKLTQLTVAEGV